MRPRDERRIADDRDAAEGHARRRQVVDRLQDRLVDQPHHRAELRRQQPLGGRAHRVDRGAPDQRRRNRDRMHGAALVGEQVAAVRSPRRPAGTTPRCSGDGRGADRRPGRSPDSRGTARRAAGRTSCTRTARDGCRAGTPPRGSARARPHSRHRAAPAPAGIAGGWSSGCRRPPPAGRPRPCCRRRSAPPPTRPVSLKRTTPRPRW